MNSPDEARFPKAGGTPEGPDFSRPLRRLPDGLERVLVIDDQDDFHRLAAKALEPRGVRVKGAFTGADGVAIARVFLPNLIILDWVLKEMSGEDVARHLRLDPATKSIPTIMVSSHMDPGDAQRARQAGAHCFMTKMQFQDVLHAHRTGPAPAPSGQDLILRRGCIEANLSRDEVFVMGRRVELSPQLFVLLRLLISSPGAVLTKRLLSDGWPEGSSEVVVTKAVQRLRAALHLRRDPIATTVDGYKLIG